MPRETIHRDDVPDPRPNGFSQGVRAAGLVFLAGQIGIAGNDAPPVGFEEQLRQAFRNVERLLSEVGSTLDDIVSTTVYVTDIEDKHALVRVRRELFGSENLPASALVQVGRLGPPNACVEVQAVAIDRERTAS
jgi:2-iminobutanoate/2-iminopropanoate deaminase